MSSNPVLLNAEFEELQPHVGSHVQYFPPTGRGNIPNPKQGQEDAPRSHFFPLYGMEPETREEEQHREASADIHPDYDVLRLRAETAEAKLAHKAQQQREASARHAERKRQAKSAEKAEKASLEKAEKVETDRYGGHIHSHSHSHSHNRHSIF
jgi:hypothetical protein